MPDRDTLLERTWQAHSSEVVIVGVTSKDVAANLLSFLDEFDVTARHPAEP